MTPPQACQFKKTTMGYLCLTHPEPTREFHYYCLPSICDIGLAALSAQLDTLDEQSAERRGLLFDLMAALENRNCELKEQGRLIGRLRAALEEGVVRHLELDRWTLERVEADPDAYIHVIRKALSPATEPQ